MKKGWIHLYGLQQKVENKKKTKRALVGGLKRNTVALLTVRWRNGNGCGFGWPFKRRSGRRPKLQDEEKQRQPSW